MTAHTLLLFVFMSLVAVTGIAETRTVTSPSGPGLDQTACDRMKARGVLAAHAPVGCDKLAIVRFAYVDFAGRTHHDGEIMVMTAVADSVKAIFDTLHARRFPIARARLIDHYSGDDMASMNDNNTSAFNHRPVTGAKLPSLHAYGLAIDLNPMQNPFLQLQSDGTALVSPPSAIKYANRSNQRPGKAARPGMAEDVIALFANHGFLIWGGDWDAPVDYQHFQVGRKMAERMAALPVDQARALFSDHVRGYRTCLKIHHAKTAADARVTCIEKHQ